MSTPGKVSLGIFLTLLALCQLGTFDPQFTAYFESRALADADWLTRTLYPLFGPHNLVAETRSENPIGFAVIAAIPSFGITFVAYVFLMGLAAMSKTAETNAEEAAETVADASAS